MPRSPKARTNKDALTPVFSMRLDDDVKDDATALVTAIAKHEPDRDPVSRTEVLRRALRLGIASLGEKYGVKVKTRAR